jgi:hypothetical protein
MGHDRLLATAGWCGLALGLAAVVTSGFGGELASLVRGYGSLVMASATYLLLGLAARRLLAWRSRPSSGPVAISTERRA